MYFCLTLQCDKNFTLQYIRAEMNVNSKNWRSKSEFDVLSYLAMPHFLRKSVSGYSGKNWYFAQMNRGEILGFSRLYNYLNFK